MRTALSRKRVFGSQPERLDDKNKDEESLLRRDKQSGSVTGSPAKASFNKIFAGSNHSRGIVGLLQDIMGGVFLGTMGMSLLLLLDYSNVINLETARVFRRTASDMFSAPETVQVIESEIGMKLVPMESYDAMQKELRDSRAVIEQSRTLAEVRAKKATSMKSELEPLKGEYDALIKQTGFDVFCPDCHWGMGMNCQKRLEYILENYSDTATRIVAIGKLVKEGVEKNGKCITTTS